MSEKDRSRNTVKPWRITSFIVALGIVFTVFSLRLFSLQILQGDVYTAQAEENRILEIFEPTQRGVIYDRNGIVLARNVASYNVIITPAFLPDDAGAQQEIFRQLSLLTGTPLNKGSVDDPLIPCGDNLGISQMAEKGVTFAPYQPVHVKCDVSKDIALIVEERAVDWPGVGIEIEPVRDYPTGGLMMTASFIGYLGPIPASLEQYYRDLGFLPNRDKIGYAGVEWYFQDVLSGTNGRRVVEVDVAGQILRDLEAPIPSEPGLNLKLTIDTKFQNAVEAILVSEINGWNAFLGRTLSNKGVAIVMNPKTGEILALVSYPTYENNRFARFIPLSYYLQLAEDPLKPLINHAIGGEFPVGSVFKLVTAVGALNEGVVTPDQMVQTPGLITITEKFSPNDPGYSREFVDWNRAGFGQLDFIGGLANSSNVYFYKLGGGYPGEIEPGLGICRLYPYAHALGYGDPRDYAAEVLQDLSLEDYEGIELPGQAYGLVPSPTWKRINQGENWSIGDTYIAGVGQGFVLSTPLQVMLSAATIANDGRLMRPTLLREIVDDEGKVIQPFKPDMVWDLTQTPIIPTYANPAALGTCKLTDAPLRTIEPWVFDTVQAGMRGAVTFGTLLEPFEGMTIAAAGKTGTAEYCDLTALKQGRCVYGGWPTHSWTVAYAPNDNPEIVVVAFVYNGGEGASVAAPIVRRIIDAYFDLKSIDTSLGGP